MLLDTATVGGDAAAQFLEDPMVSDALETRTPRRQGRSRKRRDQAAAAESARLPTLQRQIGPLEVLDRQGVERVHEASIRILEEFGIEFRDPEALAYWRDAGAQVDGERVRIPGALLMDLVAKIPRSFTLHARNPARNVEIGVPYTAFSPGYGAPVVRDLEDRRRDSTLADFHNYARLAYRAPAVHVTGGVLCEPMDVPVPKRHLRMLYGLIRESDKPFVGMVTSRERAEDSIAMAETVFGKDFLDEHPVLLALCNGNTPLVWDKTMLDALKVYAGRNQPVMCTPFIIAGVNTPASPAGAVAQLNAEALAAIAFGQLVRPGSPMIYGATVHVVSMKSGAPVSGGPESWLITLMIGQLARRYGLPWRISAGRTSARCVDVYAGYETAMNLVVQLLAGANIMLNAGGLIESGLVTSYAKLLLDFEQLEMLYRFAGGVGVGDLDEVLPMIGEVGPGGHHLGTAHTLANFKEAFYIPQLHFVDSFEQWTSEGAKDSNQRALERARDILANHREPPIDPGLDEALRDFVARREAELPDQVEG